LLDINVFSIPANPLKVPSEQDSIEKCSDLYAARRPASYVRAAIHQGNTFRLPSEWAWHVCTAVDNHWGQKQNISAFGAVHVGSGVSGVMHNITAFRYGTWSIYIPYQALLPESFEVVEHHGRVARNECLPSIFDPTQEFSRFCPTM
jgi:hypothetical protein